MRSCEIIIRKVLTTDLSSLLPLMDQLGYSQSLEDLQKRFEIFNTHIDYGFLLAELDNQVVGLVAWSKSHLFVSATSRIHIEGLVVNKKFRAKGVGKKLMLAVEALAEKLGTCIIDLTSGLHREKDGAHDFYRSLGYDNKGDNTKIYLRKVL